MKKKLKSRGYVLIVFILILLIWGYWHITVSKNTSTPSNVIDESVNHNSIKEKDSQSALKAKALKQVVKLRATAHSSERLLENKTMPYHLQLVKGIDPKQVNVVRWPNDQNDQWRDSKGKAFPIGRYTGRATIRDNPSKDLKYIRKYGGGEAFIGYLNGEKGMEIPTRKKINGKIYLLSNWLWLDSRTLVGVMSHDLAPNDHTEYGDTRIYLYKINNDLKSGQLVEVSTPFIPHRSTIKIEGVTSNGNLALSRVYDGAADGIKFNYTAKTYSSSGYEPEKFLGVFEIKE